MRPDKNPHIVIDARKIADYGIGTYIRFLAEGMAEQRPEWQYSAFIGPENAGRSLLPPAWQEVPVSYGTYGPGEFFLLGQRIKELRATVFHAPHFTIPFRSPRHVVVTIHDLIPLLFPRIFGLAKRSYASYMISHALRQSDLVMTSSEKTREDLQEHFGTDKERIVVVPLGVSNEFFAGMDRESRGEAFRSTYHIDHPYILFIGNMKAHKGIDVLLGAMRLVAQRWPDVVLVLVGGDKQQAEEHVLRQSRDLVTSGRIRLLGRIPQKDVPGAYAGAALFAFPSLYEGFGLPALEAMASQTPCVTSDGGALPEVVGDAAEVVPAGNSEALAEALSALLQDSARSRRLVAKGLERAKYYSWKKTALGTIARYEDLMRNSKGGLP